MKHTEQTIAIVARLYEVRRAARDIRGDKYAEDMVTFKKAVLDHAKAKQIDFLPAAIELGKLARDKGGSIDLMLFMSAVVELTEEQTR